MFIKVLLIAAVCTLLLGSAASAKPKKGRSYYEATGDVVWEVPTAEKVIALTFDDGPDLDNTPPILDLLKQYQAKATFFVTGVKVERYPELIRREHNEGHELANHTYSHKFLNNHISSDILREEVTRADKAIFEVSGQRSHLFRPPGGFYNEKIVKAAKQSGYTVILWCRDTRDWSEPGVHQIVDSVLGHTKNGDIVLFHDYANGTTQTFDALKIILPVLKQQGYRFVTVSELLSYSGARKNPRLP